MDSDHVLINFTLVAARLGFLAGERTGPTADSASDHSSVEIEIVGFLDRYMCYVYRFGIAWWRRKKKEYLRQAMAWPLSWINRVFTLCWNFLEVTERKRKSWKWQPLTEHWKGMQKAGHWLLITIRFLTGFHVYHGCSNPCHAKILQTTVARWKRSQKMAERRKKHKKETRKVVITMTREAICGNSSMVLKTLEFLHFSPCWPSRACRQVFSRNDNWRRW